MKNLIEDIEKLKNNKKAFSERGYSDNECYAYRSAIKDTLSILNQYNIITEQKSINMRTEQDVLKDFEKLGYKIYNKTNYCILVYTYEENYEIRIWKDEKIYSTTYRKYITIQEHKLLNELFTIWRWI